MASSNGQLRQWENYFLGVALCLVIIGGLVCLQPGCFPTHDQQLVQKILTSLEKREAEAYTLAQEYLKQPGAGSFGIALAAGAAAANFDDVTATKLYQQLPADGGNWEFQAAMGLARRSLVNGRLMEAEQYLRRAQLLAPHDVELNSRLSHLLQVTGRTWEAIPLFFILVARGKCRGDELLGLASPEQFLPSDVHLESMGLALDPPDLMAKLAIARRQLIENQSDQAELLFKEIVQAMPQWGEAQGRLGRILFERGDAIEVERWRRNMPEAARRHPEVWFVLGLHARRSGQLQGAARCFLEALNLAPNHAEANQKMSECLTELHQPELAGEFAVRAKKLVELESLLSTLTHEISLDVLQDIIAACGELGRYWEAAGWANVLSRLQGTSGDPARREARDWFEKTAGDLQQNAVPFIPSAKLRVSDFAEPDWNRI